MSSASIRYALGLLRGAQSLRGALEDLAREGVPASQLKVLVPEHVREEWRKPWRATDGPPSLDTWTVCPPSTDPGCSPFDLERARDQADPTGLLGAQALQRLHGSPLQRSARQLASHVRAGGIILLVRVFQNDEEQAVCRTLLRHAAGGVQTHEFPVTGGDPYPASGQPSTLGTHVWLTVTNRQLHERGDSASRRRIIPAR